MMPFNDRVTVGVRDELMRTMSQATEEFETPIART